MYKFRKKEEEKEKGGGLNRDIGKKGGQFLVIFFILIFLKIFNI